jgi:peptidoglycan-associated lipoprotein
LSVKNKQLRRKRDMGKRVMRRGWLAMAFVGALLLLLTSCAEKQIDVTEGIQPPAEVKGDVVVVKEAPKEVLVEVEGEGEQLPPELARKIERFQNENIYFDFDKSDLKPEAQEILKMKAAFLRENPGYYVLIEGNCDNRGTEEYNLALGERRAASARDYLVTLGVSAGRLKTISYGELRPADPRNNEEAWALNRRDEFKLYK